MAFIGNQIITINSLLDLDGQELVLDSDADSTIHVSTDDQIDFKIGGTDVATFTNSSSDFVITQAVQDKDIIFKGDDGGSAITALTLDMSEAGNASFNGTVTANAGVVVDNITIDGTEIDLSSGNLTIDVAGGIILDTDAGELQVHDGGTEYVQFKKDSSNVQITAGIQDGDIVFRGNDGGSMIEAMRIDMSEGGRLGIGTTSPNNTLDVNGGIVCSPNTDGKDTFELSTNDVDEGRLRIKNVDTTTVQIRAGGDSYFNGGNVGIGTSSPSRTFHVSSSSGTAVKVETSDNDKALIEFANNGSSTTSFLGSADDAMQFGTGGSERMRIDSGGNVGINRTPNSTIKLDVETSGTNHPARFKSDHVSYGTIFDNIAGSGNRFFCDFRINNSTKGKIFSDGSTTTFSTSSDYRLKENVVTDWDATTRLKQLKPSRFNFKENKDITYDGFLAHEVSSIVPQAVDGEKDAVDENGNPQYQGIDQSKLVPLLTKALQEAISEIDTLKEKVTALESK